MDAERRAAERAVRANPLDLAAAHALAEALRRSGDRRGLFHALCALARGGDAEAAVEVEAWHPWPGPDGRGNRRAGVGRPVRDPVRTRVGRLAVGVPRAIAGASATHLFVVCVPPGWDPTAKVVTPGEVLVAVDLATLEVTWRVESEMARTQWERPAVLVGEEVAWGTGDAVRVVSSGDGTERLRLPLGLASHLADRHALFADGDRLLVAAGSEPGAVLLVSDLTGGRPLWERRNQTSRRPVAVFDDELLVADGRTRALSDGRLVEPPRGQGRLVHAARLGRGDHMAIVQDPEGRRLVRFAQGHARWWTQLPGASARDQVAVADRVVAGLASRPDGTDEVLAHAVESGVLLWSHVEPPSPGPLPARSLAATGGDVVLLSAGPSSSRLLGLAPSRAPTLDVTMSSPLRVRPPAPHSPPLDYSFDQTLDLPLLVRPPFRDIARVDFAELVALDGALLIVATGDEGDLVLARVDGAA